MKRLVVMMKARLSLSLSVSLVPLGRLWHCHHVITLCPEANLVSRLHACESSYSLTACKKLQKCLWSKIHRLQCEITKLWTTRLRAMVAVDDGIWLIMHCMHCSKATHGKLRYDGHFVPPANGLKSWTRKEPAKKFSHPEACQGTKHRVEKAWLSMRCEATFLALEIMYVYVCRCLCVCVMWYNEPQKSTKSRHEHHPATFHERIEHKTYIQSAYHAYHDLPYFESWRLWRLDNWTQHRRALKISKPSLSRRAKPTFDETFTALPVLVTAGADGWRLVKSGVVSACI